MPLLRPPHGSSTRTLCERDAVGPTRLRTNFSRCENRAVGARRRTIRRALLVLSIALFFRIFRLDSLPGFSQDEAYGALNAAKFAAGEPLHPLRLYAEGLSQDVVGGYQPGVSFALPSTFFPVFCWALPVWRLAWYVL